MTAAAVAASLWIGPFAAEARAAFARARERGASANRAMTLGQIASYKDGWIPRKTIARRIGCSIRTVQRGITQGKELGLLGTARAKKDEIPPGLEAPLPCGWSHRWTIGWGKAGAAVNAAVDAARARWMVRQAARATAAPTGARRDAAGTAAPAAAGQHGPVRTAARPSPRREYQRRNWTAEQIDAELERLAREQPPPD